MGDQGVYRSQAIWGTKGLTSRKPFGGPRGLQVASHLGDQVAYKSQALCGTKGHTSRKPFGGTKALAQVVSPFGEQGAYKSQGFLGTKGLTSRKPFGDQGACTGRKPFGVPRDLQVASLLGTKRLTSRKPFGGQRRLHKSQALWGTKGLVTCPLGDKRALTCPLACPLTCSLACPCDLPFGGPKGLWTKGLSPLVPRPRGLKVANHFVDHGACTIRKPFGRHGPTGCKYLGRPSGLQFARPLETTRLTCR